LTRDSQEVYGRPQSQMPDVDPSTAAAQPASSAQGEQQSSPAAIAMSPIGEGWVPRMAILVLLAFVLLAACVLLYGIWAFWPTTRVGGADGGALAERQQISFFGAHTSANLEIALFVIVAGTGALGGVIHTIRSLTWYLGNRSLRWSWVPFCVLLPFVGASGATVFYLVFRAGLFSPSTTTTQVNPFGFAAIAALVGLFSEQAMEKLRDVFGSLLAPAPAGEDHVNPQDVQSEANLSSPH
jgi:hypothetical protein